uniref:Pectinesterase catalytic domain-containing protein n=1 Tax=Solanum lycopersicum TaxID=4081 RepID=A0A3Q7IGV3_SOLLC
MPRQYNTIKTQKRDFEPFESGIVLQNCTIKATSDLEKLDNVTTYLGRLWGIFSRTVIIESYIDKLNSVISRWSYYLEYKNRGLGDVRKGRVTWASITTDLNIASNLTVRHFIKGIEWMPTNILRYLDFD